MANPLVCFFYSMSRIQVPDLRSESVPIASLERPSVVQDPFYLPESERLFAADDQTPWTPAINLAMGWAASLRELEDEGLENRWNRCKTLADGVRRLFSDLGFMLLADAGQQSDTVTAIMYPEGMNDSWRSKLKDEYGTQVIGAQDHLKGKMFRVGSMGTTTIEEMIEGCNRMIACFNEMGHALPNVDVASYFA